MKHNLLFILLCISLFATSCSDILYVPYMPDKVNSPGFSEAKEVKVDVTASPFTRASVDVAYSPINHLVLIGSYRRPGMKSNSESTSNGQPTNRKTSDLTGNRFDIGAGYFSSFEKKGRFEAIGGFGMGKLDGTVVTENINPYTIDRYDYRMNMIRGFAQVGAGIEGDIFSLMGGVKLCWQQYNNFTVNSTNGSVPFVFGDGPLHVQPYFDMRIGYKYVKFTTQMGFSYSTLTVLSDGPGSGGVPGVFPWPYITAGLVFHLAPKFTVKKD
jgi:hypothetical protein